jgi:hypothetical protein
VERKMMTELTGSLPCAERPQLSWRNRPRIPARLRVHNERTCRHTAEQHDELAPS